MLKLFGLLFLVIVVAREVLAFSVNVGWISPDVKSILEAILIVASLVVGSIKAGLSAYERYSHSRQQINHRTELIKNVRLSWISGVLDETLKDASFRIPVETRPEQAGDSRAPRNSRPASERPNGFALRSLLNAKLRVFNQRADLITPEAIARIYHGALENLLILGAPGSGKTMLLLELARSLLREAERDETKGVPVVFNLASWGTKARRLDDWLITELKRHYGVSNQLANQWIDSDSLIYLLDGLDEVAEDLRENCLDAINAFISVPRQLAVCSRLAEYELLSTKVNSHDAIELQPLSQHQVERVLSQHLSRDTAKAIMDCITANDTVWQELNRPLFINILISTYVGGKVFSPLSFETGTKQHIQQLIIEPFLIQQLRNNPDHSFSNNLTWRYLSWIAHNLQRCNRSQFYVEMVQGDWLPKLPSSNRSVLPLLSLLRRIRIDLLWKVEIVSFRRDGYRTLFSFLVKCFRPSKLVVILGTFAASLHVLFPSPSNSNVVMILVMYIYSVVNSLFKVLWPFGSRQVTSRSIFNQGMSDSFRLGFTRMVRTGLLLGLIVAIVVPIYLATSSCLCVDMTVLLSEPPGTLLRLFVIGFAIGTLLGATHEMAFGSWNNHLKHVMLRTVLWRKELAPRQYDRFLQMVVDRRLMRRVGGSVLFVHRYILEYFADQWDRSYKEEYD